MDISSELKKFYSIGNEQLQKDIQEEIEILKKKSYFFNVMSIADKFDEKIKSGFFNEANIFYLKLKQYHDYDLGECFEIDVLDKFKRKVSKYKNGNNTVEFDFIENSLGHYYFTLEDNLYNEEIKGKKITIAMDISFKDKIKEVCLNKELLSLANYVKLDGEVKDKLEEKKIIKLKI